MFLTEIGPTGHREEMAVDSMGLTLGAIFAKHEPYKIVVNGKENDDWQNYVPINGDRVEVFHKTEDFGIFSGPILASVLGTTLATATTIASVVSSLIVSVALSAIMRALTPKPKKPSTNANPTQAFGINGFNNTTGPGTPKFVPYGLNKIRGHVIASGADISPDGQQMFGRVLYFMGWAGGDGVGDISGVTLDGTAVEQFEEITVQIRGGTDGQDVIPEFENVDNLFNVGLQLGFDINLDFPNQGTPIIYSTKSATVDRVRLFFFFPGGLYRIDGKGKQRPFGVKIRVEFKKHTDSHWTLDKEAEYNEQFTSPRFKFYDIYFPSTDQWDIRVTKFQVIGPSGPSDIYFADIILFNVQETRVTTRNYPGWALLALTNIPAKKIRSLEAMDVAAMMWGKQVKIPDGAGGFYLSTTRKRCWIVRDMMTHPIVGMGSEIDETEIDVDQWLESQNYYDEIVQGHDGLELRDYCDVVVNTLDWDWEWVKKVAGEARGRIIPSGDKWKYVIDKPGEPNILYSEGGNIIENSVNLEISPPDRPFTQITAQFRDSDQEYETNWAPPIFDPEAVSPVQETFQYDTITRESQVQRENMIVFKRQFLERRRWRFSSPIGAIVSEPMDLDYMAERGIGNEGAYGGIVPPGSTLFTVLLPDVVKLEVGETYAIVVKHRLDNTTEYRLIATGSGTWGQIDVTSPFVQAPVEGDIFSLGIQDVDHIVTRAQELEMDRDGHISQVRTEYVPAVYTQDPLPSKSERRFFGPHTRKPPIPLADAVVMEEVALNRDGSTRSTLMFDVSPGLVIHSGLVQGGLVDRVTLAPFEPDRDGYYNTALITVGTSTHVSIYVGVTRTAFVTSTFNQVPQPGDNYTIRWERFGEFGGFRVETSEDGEHFSNFATCFDTHLEMDSRGQGPGLVYFRFTPISTEGVENSVARIIKGVTVQGDLSAPAPPAFVNIHSHLLSVQIRVTLNNPIAEDFSGVIIEVYRIVPPPTTVVLIVAETRFGASYNGELTGTTSIEAGFNLGAKTPPEAYGAEIWCRARTVDKSDNRSDWVQVSQTTILTPDPGSSGIGVGPPAVPTGLHLATGVQIDPSDGTAKPFLDVSWDANTEPDMSRYEVHYRQQADPNHITVRTPSHPQISIREIGIIGNIVYEARVQAIDTANNVSGFTAWLAILSARDTQAPGAPLITSIIGGFHQISFFFQPPNDPDFECVQVFVSGLGNDLSLAVFWGESAARSINYIISGPTIVDDFTYFIWIRSRDHSGNVSGFSNSQFNGVPATTRQIGPGDIVTTNLITQFAQIGDALITNAHIRDLSADKITGGRITAFLGLGVGGQIYIDGVNRLFWVIDDRNVVRVQLGKLGPAATDYGLQIFGPDASLWWSFASGMQTQGISNNAITDITEFSNDFAQDFSTLGGQEVLVGQLSIVTSGAPVVVHTRVRLNPSSGASNRYNITLRRNGIQIDFIEEVTNQGKTIIGQKIDSPGAGFNLYELVVSLAVNPNTGGQWFATYVRIGAVEIKK